MIIALIILASAISSGLGDYCCKKYSVQPSLKWGLWIALAYTFGTYFWVKMLCKFQSLAQAGKIWVLAATITMLLISQFIFHETVSARQWIGIILGLLSILLML